MIAAVVALWIVDAPTAQAARVASSAMMLPLPPTRPLEAESTEAPARALPPSAVASAGTEALSFGTVGLSWAPPSVSPDPPPPEPLPSAEPRLLERRSVPPFWIDRIYGTHRTRALAFPPLFLDRRPRGDHPEKFFHADLSFTFGWYSRNKARRRWVNPFGLFFGGFSERKTVWAAVPLLMGYRRVGEQFNFGQFPLVWWWGTKFVKNFLVVPFHYQQKSPAGFTGVSALLFWYGHKNLDDASIENDRRHFVAAPLFWRFSWGLRRFDFAFLYVGGGNKLQGRRWAAAPPLGLWIESEFGNRRELWSWAFVRRVDEARRRKSWAVPPLLTFAHHDPRRTVVAATPLFWNTHDRLLDRKFTLAGPFGWLRDPDQSNAFFAPLYYRFHDRASRSTTQILAPLLLTRRTPRGLGVWTPIAGGRRTERGWAAAIPLALTFATKRDDGSRLGAIAGLLWHASTPGTADRPRRDTWVAGPLGFYDRLGAQRRLGLPPLLSFFGWGERGRHYQVITPLLWHVRDAAAQRRTLVAGPFYHHRDRAGIDGGLVPLAFWGKNERFSYGAAPLLLTAHVYDARRSTALTLSPLFVRSRGPDHRTLGVLGLGWDVLREHERHTVVFPLLYRRRVADRTLWLTPVGGQLRTEDTLTRVFGPFVQRRTPAGSGLGVLPLFWHGTRRVPGGLARYTVVPPLVVRHRDPDGLTEMWTPLVWRTASFGERPRRGLAVLPFYVRRRAEGGVDFDGGLGWFWARNEQRRTHTLVAGPFFHRLSRKALHTGLAPLVWWTDSEEKRRLIALPLIFHFADKRPTGNPHTTIALPFWFDRERPNGRRAWAAFPFAFGGSQRHDFLRFSLAPPGFFDIFRLQKNYRFTGFVPLLFRYQKGGFQRDDAAGSQYTLWGSIPFFLYGRDGQGRRTHAALLYYWDRDPKGYRLYTPLFGITNRPSELVAWYAGPVGVRISNTHRRVFAFPFYYRKAHRVENESLTLALPPLFVARQKKDRSFFEAGLVVWQFRQRHKVTTTVLPPIFYHSHTWAQRKLYWLAPLFIRDNNIAKDETWTAIPLLYTQHRKGQDLDFVQFPLVWHIERGENQGTVGGFLWWDIRVRGKTFQTVPGAFFRWVTPEADTKVIGPGLAWWTRGRGIDEGDRSWRILFGILGGGVEDGERYVAVFGRRIARGPRSARVQARRAARAEARAARRAARQARRDARRARMAERRRSPHEG